MEIPWVSAVSCAFCCFLFMSLNVFPWEGGMSLYTFSHGGPKNNKTHRENYRNWKSVHEISMRTSRKLLWFCRFFRLHHYWYFYQEYFVWSCVGAYICLHHTCKLDDFCDARFATWSRPRAARPKTTPACIQLSVPLHSARIQLAVRCFPSRKMHVLPGPVLIHVYRRTGLARTP